MPSNNIAFARNYTSVIDEVYQRASVSGVLNSGRRMVRAGHNAKEILIPKISVTGLGDYTRNVGYKTGAITYEFETKTFNYDRGIRLFADVMDVEEAGVNDCFVEAGAELQRTQVAPEADAFTFAQIALMWLYLFGQPDESLRALRGREAPCGIRSTPGSSPRSSGGR